MRSSWLVALAANVLAVVSAEQVQGAQNTFPLQPSSNHRYLVDQQNKPFLVVGDTAWSLVAQLNQENIIRYLDDRAQRGFNAIMVNLIEHKYATHAPAALDGTQPFLNPGDFVHPNPAYFDYAHRAIAAANERGITVWLCPAYLGWAGGDEGFFKEIKAAGPAALRSYGRFLGQHFKDLPNIIWMIGGDYALAKSDRWTGTELALGVRDGGATQLITAHGGQTTAVETFGDESWLGVETAYGYQPDIWRLFQNTYQRQPVRPFVLIESTYEGEHDARPEQVRRQAWWAILCGACGQFFGNNPLWHYDGPGLFKSEGTWQQALSSVGSRDMTRLGAFLAQQQWWKLQPDLDNKLISAGRGEGTRFISAAATADWAEVIIYVPSEGVGPREFTLETGLFLKSATVRWFNPAKDAVPKPGQMLINRGAQTVRTPGDNGTGASDWVLILEAAP